jgi:hypothetical protein
VREAQIPYLAYALDLGILPPGFRDRRVLQIDRLAKNSDSLFVAEQIATVGKGHRGAFVNTQRPAPMRLLRLVAGSGLAKKGAGQLGRESELLTGYSVESAGEAVGVQLLGLKYLLGYPTGGGKVSGRHGIEMLGLSHLDLDCADCFQYKTT